MANKGLRAAARGLDAVAEVILVAFALLLLGDRYRLGTSLFVAWLAVAAYETATTAWLGGTPGKRIVGLRVVELDHRGRPRPGAAWRRSALSALFVVGTPLALLASLSIVLIAGSPDVEGEPSATVGVLLALATVVVVGAWVLSTFGDPLGRGFTDRTAATMVVPERWGRVVTIRELPGFADGARPPRLAPLGRVADADVRARARLRRLDDVPVLAGAIGLLALVVSVPIVGEDPATVRLAVLGSSIAWIALFVADETRRIARTGATPGHLLAGLVVTRRDRFGPPSAGRSFARALVLALTLYVPPLWPLLGTSLLMMRYGRSGRGLHDLAGGTIVISDPSLSPEMQRQRSMRMRLGRAG